METIHHSRSSELSVQGYDDQYVIFDSQLRQECDNWSKHSSLNEEPSACYCNSFTERHKQDFGMVDCNHSIPQTSASTSLSCYGGHDSSFGSQIELHSKNSFVAVDAIRSRQSLVPCITMDYHGCEGSFPHIGIECSIANSGLNGSIFQMSPVEHTPSNPLTGEDHEKSSDGRVECYSASAGVVRFIGVEDDVYNTEDAKLCSKTSNLSIIDANPLIWIPPEPEDMETAIDSFANDDDDDYDSDNGTRWGQPSSLSCLDEVKGNSFSHKEERQRVMMEVMNGQFKILVSRLLSSVGVTFSRHVTSENWLNIVTSLSWEAALLVKPDASEGRAMDPLSYLKVKCVASGARCQSQVIKGLVFKKNAAHKHMPTKFRNARILLLKGSLGHSANGLSSFESMGQEKDHFKSIIDIIEACHPNVVFVEKSVSRDIQEALLGKGMTLVFDMKLPRMERIARCTGSRIVSIEETILKSDLEHCEYFHIEKFVEEHNSFVDGAKRPAKTLMFLKGCPKPLGCTILLNGANSDELKKIKYVLPYAVFAAYHLVLETSYFADQRTFFCDMNSARAINGVSPDEMASSFDHGVMQHVNFSHCEDSLAGATSEYVAEIPISDASMTDSLNEPGIKSGECSAESPVLLESSIASLGENTNQRNVYNNDDTLQPVSEVSACNKNKFGENLSPLTSQSISSYFGFTENGRDDECSAMVLPLDTSDYEKHLNKNLNNKTDSEFYIGGMLSHSSDPCQITEPCIDEISKNAKQQKKDDIESGLDAQSILVLMSRYCATKQAACEESHLSRIKYYGNFDVSLGRYLRDILLSQNYSCASCGETTEAHIYRYTHQNGNLTAIIKKLPKESVLPGEAEGKIWMWTWCLKCEHAEGYPKASRRVVMSSAARSLSFGKFLDLSFSEHSAANRLSRCGHLLHRDCLRFFGLGSKVAMFRYSPIEIYAACKPQPMLDFYNQNGQEWLCKEAKDVLTKGEHLFCEITGILKSMEPQNARLQQLSKFSGSMKQISEVEDTLKQERTAFEVSLLEFVYSDLRQKKNVNGILDLSWLIQELLLMLYIWDRRLHLLFEFMGSFLRDEISEVVGDSIMQVPVIFEEPFSGGGDRNAGNHLIDENLVKIESAQLSEEVSGNECFVSTNHDTKANGNFNGQNFPVVTEEHPALITDQGSFNTQDSSLSYRSKCLDEVSIPILDNLQEENSLPVQIVPLNCIEANKSQQRLEENCANSQKPAMSQQPCNSDAEDSEQWIWAPFSELRKAYRKDLHGGSLHKFQFINGYIPFHLTGSHKLITREYSLHFAVGSCGNVISLADDEISSIIACALALFNDQDGLVGVVAEKKGKGEVNQRTDTSHRSEDSADLSHHRTPGSFEFDANLSSSEELSSHSSDDSLFVDQLIASDNLHPEINVGTGKVAGKSRYSVICIYAKDFYSLRKKCCPSELLYISSLSRCKKWDAQGGKSKVFFAKTMDDRFIIKQIRKTELDSFLKFGPEYFRYFSFSLDSGNQTCLAKILGIYQVRQLRNGKEVKTDLMVMENLLFGRNVSRKYDLKGAIFSRYISDANDSNRVLLDENFVEDMRLSPVYVGGRTKHLLQRAIWNDTAFLTSINVMDYSLFVGVDKERHALVFGIIDYLRQYTWDKQLETWVKSSLVPKNALPTVISPKEYKKRFRKFMSRYFLTLPDTWSCNQCSDFHKPFLSG